MDSELPAAVADLATTSTAQRSTVHPSDLTSFVGRQVELGAMRGLFDSGTRLVTLFGPAGMGKTRLARRLFALESSAQLSPLFCDLQAATTAEDVCVALGGTLGVALTETSALADLAERLGQALAARNRCLVVFDNFEQLVDAARPTLESWLLAAPLARFLVTSRRLLRLTGESAYELSPLAMPATDDDWNSEAMRLFVERARSVEPSFSIASPQARHVAPLVRQLEGVPLAIELAATQIRRAGPGEILRGLEGSPLGLRATAMRPIPDRHATLRTAIDCSWRLLTPAEQRVLMQLTVFRGGFDREAAKAVVDGGPPEPDVVELVARLREASWLRATAEDPLRWDLYESIREYGAERLATSDESERIRANHAAYFLEKGETEASALGTSNGPRARSALVRDLDNLRVAFHWFHGRSSEGAAENTARIALVMHATLRTWMPASAIGVLNAAIDHIPAGSGNPSTVARLLVARVETQRAGGNYDDALADLTQVEGLSDVPIETLLEAQLQTGLLQFERGDASASVQTFETALQQAEALPFGGHLTGRLLAVNAWVRAEFFRDPVAFEHWRRAASLLREAGDTDAATSASALSDVFRVIIEGRDVGDELREHLATARRLGHRENEITALTGLGLVHLEERRPEQAREAFEHVRELAERGGLQFWHAAAVCDAGLASDLAGDVEDALYLFEHAHQTASSSRCDRLRLWGQLAWGGALARKGDADRAAGLIQAAKREYSLVGHHYLEALADLQWGHVLLARSRHEAAEGNLDESVALRRGAMGCLNAARTGRPNNSRPLLDHDLGARVFAQILGRELDDAQLAAPVLLISHDGGAFQLGNHPRVDLPDGAILRRLLQSLVDERIARPGSPLSTDELFRRGWPGERIYRESGAKRVWNVVVRLRRSGLQNVLLRSKAGYYLDPRLPLQVEDRQPSEYV